MICPLCKKHETSIVSDKLDKKNNTVKRKRYCKCGNHFMTFEKFYSLRKKRKLRPSSYWKNERMYFYGLYRYNAGVDAWKKLLGKFNITSKELFDQKYPGVLSIFLDSKNKKKINSKDIPKYKIFYEEKKGKAFVGMEINNKTLNYPVETKKDTIKKILEQDEYWEIRENVLDKPVNDKKNLNLFRKEIDEYYKSVCSYIKDEEFNQDFFIKNDPDLEWFWKSDNVWTIYKTVI